ncbi:MAG TPA: carboxypeptidase-like regulatory domain-containing protein [Solirubrobacteraceae bacterium]
MLLEVVISALLVGLIAVGTFSAFDAAGKSTAGSRAHAQATVIAQQDEERLRGLTTTQLAQLGSVETARAENGYCLEQVSGAWHYWSKGSTWLCENPTGLSGSTYTYTVFTVTSSASYVTAEKGIEKAALTCEKSGGAANYLQTTSSVSWPSLGTHPPVSQSGIVTVPTSGVLLVKVLNQNNEPIEGATVTATGTGVNITQTTPASGCVIFGGLPAETVEVDAYKSPWVDKQGKSPPPTVPAPISTTSITEKTFYLGEPGTITANFESNKVTAGITGDTFYALQTEMASPTGYVGGTAGTYASSAALTGIEGKGIFPFVKVGKPAGEAPYTVFAGDCEANNPAKVTETGEKLKAHTVQVNPKGEPSVNVEAPALTVSVYEGTSAKKENLLKKSERAMIINKGCEKEKATAQNYTSGVVYKHNVEIKEGQLVQKYQPYAKELALCIVAEIGSKKWYKYESPTPFENKVKAGTNIGTFYMKATESGYEKSETAGKLTCP